MQSKQTIAIDAMGGDFGPQVTIPAAAIALERRPDLKFMLFGDETIIAPILADHEALAARSQVIHTDTHVAMDDKPSQAVRRGRGS